MALEVQQRSVLSAFANDDPETLPHTDHIPARIRMSRRELSLIVERLVMALDCPQGMWPGVRDFVLETIAVTGSAGLDELERAITAREPGRTWTGARVTDAGIDVAGESLLLAGDVIVNALLAAAADDPTAPFIVSGLESIVGSAGLEVRARYHGYALTSEADHDAGTLRISIAPCEADRGADVVQLLRNGIDVSGEQWWRIYQPSNFALSIESELSRTHTGVSETLLHYSV
ncbi:hypothetical protein [Leucobacter sp. NPDC077196]|uniref:hypothetical protein n=1 Tax=Leucobacter sp. NPDC077196 TaxID=3154959 RepID=UPI00341991D3